MLKERANYWWMKSWTRSTHNLGGSENFKNSKKYFLQSKLQDLADHGKLGRPYTILINETVGRYMVAVRDIKAGEVDTVILIIIILTILTILTILITDILLTIIGQ